MPNHNMVSVAAVVIHPEEIPEWIRFLDQTNSDQSRSESINPLRGDVTLTREGKSTVMIRFAICD